MAEGADEMNCPECGAELEAGAVDLNTVSWCCSKCGIKIYKEIAEEDVNDDMLVDGIFTTYAERIRK